MKKKIKNVMCMLLAATMILALGACGSNTDGTTVAARNSNSANSGTKADVLIKFSLSHAATEPAVAAAQNFSKEVAEKSGGKIEVQVYPDNQLGNERDVMEGLRAHTVEMVDPANAVVTNFITEFNIFSLPMLFENKQHLYAVLDTIAMGQDYQALCEKNGFKLLGWFDMGSRNIMTVKKQVDSMEDLNGLKIRNQEATVEMDGMASFGASPLTMAYNDLYTAMNSNVIDGAEAANTNYVAKAFYEVAPNWAIVGWLECVNPVLMDLEFWNSLTAEQQEIITAAAANMIKSERDLYAKSEEEALEKLKNMDTVKITYPDRAPFKEAAQSVYEKWAEELGGMEKIEEILNCTY